MRICLRRRDFIAALGGAKAWPLAAEAQGDRVRRGRAHAGIRGAREAMRSAFYGTAMDGLRKGDARLSQFRHRLDGGHADQDRHAVRAKLDRHEGLQWLERTVAVKDADLFEATPAPRPCARCRN
jgi:hypothetical protein